MSKIYAERRRHPAWQKKRMEIMERDEFKCQVCKDAETTLNVDHSYYVTGRNPWEYPDWSLRTLCEGCHKEKHESEFHWQSFEQILCILIEYLGISEDQLYDAAFDLLDVNVNESRRMMLDAMKIIKTKAHEKRRKNTGGVA